MTDEQSNQSEPPSTQSCVGDWPTFDLQFTFNPDRDRALNPDEIFVFDPERIATDDTHWISAERGSYVAIEDVR